MPQRSQASQPIHVSVTESPPILAETTVQRIYNSLLEALKTGVEVHKALNNYMPLLISELDKLLILPDTKARQVFRYAFTELWERQFPEIPPPVIEEKDTAMTVFIKAKEALAKHWDKLPRAADKTAWTNEELEELAQRQLLYFYHSVLTAVFTLMGMQM